MFKLTIECKTVAELQSVLGKLENGSVADTSTSVSVQDTVLKTKKAKIEPAKEEAKTESPLAASATSAEMDGVVAVTYSDVKNAVLEVAKLKGREASLTLLDMFGVVTGAGDARKGKIDALKPEQFTDVIAKAKGMLA